jgi:hypothetical protein
MKIRVEKVASESSDKKLFLSSLNVAYYMNHNNQTTTWDRPAPPQSGPPQGPPPNNPYGYNSSPYGADPNAGRVGLAPPPQATQYAQPPPQNYPPQPPQMPQMPPPQMYPPPQQAQPQVNVVIEHHHHKPAAPAPTLIVAPPPMLVSLFGPFLSAIQNLAFGSNSLLRWWASAGCTCGPTTAAICAATSRRTAASWPTGTSRERSEHFSSFSNLSTLKCVFFSGKVRIRI